MLFAEVCPIASIDLHSTQQICSPFKPFLNPIGRRRHDRNTRHLDQLHEAERLYRERRGETLHLPSSMSNQLFKQVAEANTLMSRSPPVAISVSSHSNEVVIRMILTNGSVIRFVVDSSSVNLLRCAIDKSISSLTENVAVSSFIRGNFGVYIACETPNKTLALSIQPGSQQREPAWDFMLTHSWLDNIARDPISMDIDADNNFLCIGYRHCVGQSWFRRSFSIPNRSPASTNAISMRNHSEISLDSTSSLVLCSWQKTATRTVLIISEKRIDSSRYRLAVAAYRLNETSEQHQLLRNFDVDIAVSVGCAALDNANEQLSVLLEDNTAVLIDLISMSCVYQLKLPNSGRPVALSWHPDDAIVAVSFTNGEVKVFDSSFQILPFISGEIQLNSVLGVECFVTLLHWHNNLLIATGNRGPVFLIRIVTGVRQQGELTSEVLVRERLRLWQFDEAAAVMFRSRNVAVRMSTFIAITQALLGLDETVVTKQVVPSERLSLYFREMWPICKGTNYFGRIRSLYNRFVRKLISTSHIESAYYHACQINDEVLFTDLYFAANSLRQDVIARLVLKRCPSLRFANCLATEPQSNPVDLDSFCNEMMGVIQNQYQQFDVKNCARLLGVALIRAHRYQDAEQLYRTVFLENELKTLCFFRNKIQKAQQQNALIRRASSDSSRLVPEGETR